MDANRSYSGHFRHYAFTWKPEFSQRQEKVYPAEDRRQAAIVPNEGYVLIPYSNGALQGRLAAVPSLDQMTTEEIIEAFINNRCRHDLDRYLHIRMQVGDFMNNADIDVLKGKKPYPLSMPMKHVALLDDRNSSTVTRKQSAGVCRPSKGPLSAPQLYAELSQERLPLSPESIPAERRLLYITDLDPYYALTLAATASVSQALFLRHFIHRYLSYRALIGIDIISSRGSPLFALEFHMPYYAWRRKESFLEDPRKRSNGDPLRRSEEVIPLETNDCGYSETDRSKYYIHEAQVSVMVTGIDDWVWAAYCFVDVYFKGESHSEQAEHYSNPQIMLDPHSCGKPANPPIWDPRQYFLRSLMCRMEQVKQEWNNSVFHLIQQTEPYIFSFTRGHLDVNKMGDITQQKGFRWTIRVLRQFSHLLTKTIDAWDNLNSGEIRYFYRLHLDELADPSWITYLAAIDKDVTELRDLRSSLQYQTELFENMTNSLVTHAQHAETIATRLQSEFIQALTVITIFYLPPSLASAIFSMQSPLLGNASLMDYGYTLLGLFIATVFLVLNLPRITAFGVMVRRWQEKSFAELRYFISKRLKQTDEPINYNEDGPEQEDTNAEESSDTGEV